MQSALFQNTGYNSASTVKLLQSGTAFFTEALALISSAKTCLHIQFYALEPDDTGNEIIRALTGAAKRGVAVRVLLDAFGSKEMKGSPLTSLKKAGVECRLFSPFILYKLHTGRRLHHKIIAADGETAIVGGINLSGKYRGTEKVPAWLDFAVRLQGPVCRDVLKICERLFYGHPSYFKKKQFAAIQHSGEFIPVRMAHADWFFKKRKLYNNLKEAIHFSQQSIVIVCSYFIPDRKMIRLLKKAAARGVQTALYLQGKSDILLARDASRYWYRGLMRNNVSIYEFPERVLHAKLAMADGKWVTIGSSNFNHLSNYTSIETNTEILSEAFCSTVKKQLQQNFDLYAQKIEPQAYLGEKNPFRLFRWWASWKLSVFLMLFLFNRTTKNG